MILTELLKVVSIDNPYSKNNQYPDFEDSLNNLFSGYDVDIMEDDLEDVSFSMGIDDDGCPYVEKTIDIAKCDVRIFVSAYHHNKWDFYLEKVEKLQGE